MNDQLSLLLRCKNKELSLTEMKEAEILKRLEILKKSFVKFTDSKSWEDAQTHFQSFASDCELKEFAKLDVSKKIPVFCKFLLESQSFQEKWPSRHQRSYFQVRSTSSLHTAG